MKKLLVILPDHLTLLCTGVVLCSMGSYLSIASEHADWQTPSIVALGLLGFCAAKLICPTMSPRLINVFPFLLGLLGLTAFRLLEFSDNHHWALAVSVLWTFFVGLCLGLSLPSKHAVHYLGGLVSASLLYVFLLPEAPWKSTTIASILLLATALSKVIPQRSIS